MADMLYILENISLPIILLIAAGYGLQKKFKLDIKTFTKINMYYLVPVVVFVKLYETAFSWGFFAQVVPYVLIFQVCMFLFALIISAAVRYKKSMRNAVTNSLVLINTGNYGIPLIDLAFHGNPIAMASQIFIVAIQNMTSYTFGVFQASSGNSSRRRALLNMVKMPALYAVLLVVVFRLFNIRVPQTLQIPLGYLTNAFIAMALTNLGMQLADTRLGKGLGKVVAVSAIKVIIAPLTGFALVLLLGIKGVLGAALIIGLSTPTAVNSAVIAQEFNNEPEFAAQVVFMTTVFCTFTLPPVIAFVTSYFGAA
jgi:predicted permease